MKLVPLTTAYRLFRRHLEFRDGRRGPVFVSWFLTRECPIRCAGCVYFTNHPTPPEDMTRAQKTVVLDGLAEIRLPFLFLAGGEPCSSPDLPYVLEGARARGIYPILVTSGLIMDRDLARTIDRHARGVIFSIDGIEEEHDRIRGQGNFARAIEGMRTFLAERRRARVYVSCVLGKRNGVDLTRFALEMKALGVDRVNFQSNCIPQLKPGPDTVPGIMAELGSLASEWSDLFVADSSYLEKLSVYFHRENNNEFCGVPTLGHLAVLPDGLVSACCEFHLPIGHAVEDGFPAVLEAARGRSLDEAKSCEGCCRKDYDLVERFFERSVPQWSVADLAQLRAL